MSARICLLLLCTLSSASATAAPRPYVASRAALTSVVFTPDGKHALLGEGASGLVSLWDLAHGRILRYYATQSDDGAQVTKGFTSAPVHAVAVSPDGKLILAGCADGTLRLWDYATGKQLRVFAHHKGCVRAVSFSPKGDQVVSGADDGELALWDVVTGTLVQAFAAHDVSVRATAFSSDGKQIASGGVDTRPSTPVGTGVEWYGTFGLWDAASSRCVGKFDAQTDVVCSVAFSRTGRYLLTARDGSAARLWEVATDKPALELKTCIDDLLDWLRWWRRGYAACFCLGGDYAVTAEEKAFFVWDLRDGRMVRLLEGDLKGCCRVAVSPDGKQALGIADGDEGDYAAQDGGRRLVLWDLETGEEIRTLAGPPERAPSVTALALSDDGSLLVAADSDYFLTFWKTETGERIASPRVLGGVAALAFSPDGRHVLSGTGGGMIVGGPEGIRLWDARTGDLIAVWDDKNGAEFVAFSPDGERALTGGRGEPCRLWDVASGRVLRVLRKPGEEKREIYPVAFSRDGAAALVRWHGIGRREVSKEGKELCWDEGGGGVMSLATGKLVTTFRNAAPGDAPTSDPCAPAPTEELEVWTSPEGELQLGDGGTGKVLRKFTQPGPSFIHPLGAYYIRAWALSRDGKWVLSADDYHLIQLWDVEKGEVSREFLGKGVPDAYFLAFTADGKRAVSAGYPVRVWDVTTGREVRRFTLPERPKPHRLNP